MPSVVGSLVRVGATGQQGGNLVVVAAPDGADERRVVRDARWHAVLLRLLAGRVERSRL